MVVASLELCYHNFQNSEVTARVGGEGGGDIRREIFALTRWNPGCFWKPARKEPRRHQEVKSSSCQLWRRRNADADLCKPSTKTFFSLYLCPLVVDSASLSNDLLMMMRMRFQKSFLSKPDGLLSYSVRANVYVSNLPFVRRRSLADNG